MDTDLPKWWSRLQPHGGTQVPKKVRDLLRLKAGDILIWERFTDVRVNVMRGKIEEVSVEWPHKTSQ